MLNIFRSKLLLSLVFATGISATADAITFGADFTGLYTATSLGQPGTIPGALGGITFLDSDTLLIGGAANGSSGAIYTIDVARGVGGHITGFSSPSAYYHAASNIDGGLSFGPGGVLFFTGYSNHVLGQIIPGSANPLPERYDLIPGGGGSVGSLAFVPDGFAGAGKMKIVSYGSGQWREVTLTADGAGTYNFTVSDPLANLGGGPEGMVYVKGANNGFGVDSVLVTEWAAGRVGVYDIDANGDPIASSRRDFITDLSGAEGAVIDPITGDFLFSTFGGGDQVVVVQGFIAPQPPVDGVPAPGAIALFGLGLFGLGALRRKLS